MGYSSEVYELARREMEQRSLYAEQELEKRRNRLYEICPRTLEIERELVKISVSAGKRVVMGADVRRELEILKEKSLGLQKELGDILTSYNLPENYLEEWYICDKCRDTGNIDGKMCSCMKSLLKKTAYEELNRISPLSLCSFEAFSLDYYSKLKDEKTGRIPYSYMQSVLKFCRKYADEFSPESHSLIFQGGSGLGKTHLSLSIAQTVIDKGYGVIYVSVPDIVSRLDNDRFSNNAERKSETEQLLNECDLLILDDLGTEYQSKFASSVIYNTLNTRLMTSHPTIISTNLSGKEIQEMYGTRMMSRIIGMLDRVEFTGNDIRQIKRRERNKK